MWTRTQVIFFLSYYTFQKTRVCVCVYLVFEISSFYKLSMHVLSSRT